MTGVQFAALDGVPEDLSQGGGVGRQVRGHALGQKRTRQRQAFEHALAGKIEIDVVLEDQGDHREVELRRGAHGLDPGQPLQLERQRVGDLVLDLLGAAAGPVGPDDDLVLGEVGDRVDRRAVEAEEAPRRHADRQEQDDEAVLDRELDDLGNHFFISAPK